MVDDSTPILDPGKGLNLHYSRFPSAAVRKDSRFAPQKLENPQLLASVAKVGLGVMPAQVVAVEGRLRRDFPGEEPAAQRAIAQYREAGALRVGQHVGLDVALE